MLIQLFLLLTVFREVTTLVTCSRCESGTEECNYSRSTCRGDFCYHAQYFYGNEMMPTLQKGCVIGEISPEGCRVNHHGNVMCFCSDADYCNSNFTSIVDVTSTILPVQTCQPEKVNNMPKPRWTKPCAANYCTFIAAKTLMEVDNANYTWSTKDCNKENEFDFFPTLTVFNFYPGTCVWLNYGGQPDTHACYGSDSLDTTLAFDTTTATTECHVDYFNPHLPYVKSGSSCLGQFCFISATSRGEVFRGCVNSQTVEGATPLKIGYTRAYTGLEQWICNQSYCNADLKSAELSWPPELYLYRNISNLREFNVFYIDSARSSSSIFLAIPFVFLINYCLFH
ncbi:hypothetical protein CRE_29979 [Caenorhabditis remanei]|uniref:DUF7622 domain-containing protein n=1 Tax=Caenorhabditis remanei TaxID=31234 RepID=E3MM01_CAERE|nr:hypothetical protein CRE_29979 [Caenorhabditis remanei]